MKPIKIHKTFDITYVFLQFFIKTQTILTATGYCATKESAVANALNHRLRNQHAIKRIFMNHW
jgi:hypothetical protein